MPTTLPIPHPAAKALSDELLLKITAEINTRGAISFSRFMQLALYEESRGYYRNALYKFGERGDFVTAPEISPLFSKCVAHKCALILAETQGDIVECGAGSGVMAADILLELKKRDQLPKHYYILEPSGFLKNVQRETLFKKIPEYLDRVIWLNTWPEKNFCGVILANEVLDAMPVTQFIVQNGFKECGVTIQNNTLARCILEPDNPLLSEMLLRYEIDFAENYISEVNLFLPAWIKSIAEFFSRGAILMIDYGFLRHEYYHPDRSQGTIMCHYQHHSHTNPLIFPGIQDITAHVDFTAVAIAAEHHGFIVNDYTTQANFLLENNLLDFLDKNADDKKRFHENQQIKQLTLPSEMGELFKVMELGTVQK